MGSMISIGVTFLLFFVVLGFMWLIGSNIVANVILLLPVISDGEWGEVQRQNIEQIKWIITFIPGILLLFAAIKMILNASGGGRD